MTYVTKRQIEEASGMNSADFVLDGSSMADEDWEDFLDSIIVEVTQAINRYCSVISFEENTVTEYYNGRGSNDDECATTDYLDNDKEFLLRRQPVISVTSISENTAGESAIPVWSSRTEQSSTVAGDFRVLEIMGNKYVRFHNNIPAEGVQNVKIIYKSGYAENSPELYEIRYIAKMCAVNYLLFRRKIQESGRIRTIGVQDSSKMFDITEERDVFTVAIRRQLDKYRNLALGGSGWL